MLHFQFPVQWIEGNSIKTRLKLSRVRSVICNSHFTKSYIDEKFGVSSTVLYPPVDLIPVGKEKKENVILTVGRFGNDSRGSSFKKQDVLVEVFKKIFTYGIKNWRFRLVVSTREEDKGKLNDLKKQLKGFPIDLLENPDNITLRREYKKAKIYWHASGFEEDIKTFPERAEHFGISTVEAMSAAAVPVVVNAGGLVESVDNGKNGLVWNSIEECVEKTIGLIRDEIQLKTFSIHAREKAELFKRERFCSELNESI